MKIMCDRCRRYMQLLKSGLTMSINNDWDLVRYDLYECPSCLHRVRTGFGKPYPNPTRVRIKEIVMP